MSTVVLARWLRALAATRQAVGRPFIPGHEHRAPLRCGYLWSVPVHSLVMPTLLVCRRSHTRPRTASASATAAATATATAPVACPGRLPNADSRRLFS